jgi:hypothetical protein
VTPQQQQPSSSSSKRLAKRYSRVCQVLQWRQRQLLLVWQSSCRQITPCAGQSQHLWIMLQQQQLLQKHLLGSLILPSCSHSHLLAAMQRHSLLQHLLLLLPARNRLCKKLQQQQLGYQSHQQSLH